MSAYHGAGLLSYGPCRFYSCHFSLSLPREQHCPHVCHIFLHRARGGEDGRYVKGYNDGCWLLLLISPRVVLATDWWEWWKRGGEEVFKECLSGVEWLSYGVRSRLETSRTALALLCFVYMNDGIGFCIWGLIREVWEVEMLSPAIALAFSEVVICRPPRESSFTIFFSVLSTSLWFITSFLLLVLIFSPASSTPFTLTITPDVQSYPWISSVNNILLHLCCFLCSWTQNDTDSACRKVRTPKRNNNAERMAFMPKGGVCVKNV